MENKTKRQSSNLVRKGGNKPGTKVKRRRAPSLAPNGDVIVRRAQSPKFFRAVLAAWAEATGRDKSMFKRADAVTVPPSVVAAARQKLGPRHEANS